MEIDNAEKINILLSGLQERYNALHIIRARVENTCTWTLGILVVLSGFFIDKNVSLTTTQSIFIIASLIAVLVVLRFFFLRDLEKGFKEQFKVVVNIEKALSLYKEGAYCDGTVYPNKWEKSGQDRCDGRFFKSSYWLLYVGFAILIVAILFF